MRAPILGTIIPNAASVGAAFLGAAICAIIILCFMIPSTDFLSAVIPNVSFLGASSVWAIQCLALRDANSQQCHSEQLDLRQCLVGIARF